MRRTGFVLFALVALLAMTFAPAAAVTDGWVDGDGHPAVVLILMEVDGEPMYRCSGTLLSPTVVLTAGHCTSNYPDGDYSGIRIFTESDVQNGNNNYPYAGPNSVEAVAWYSHPLFETAPFYFHDVGVVILKKPGVKLPSTEYGTLPSPNQFDAFDSERGLQDVTFTSVGYGRQESFPTAAAWKMNNVKIRYVATPRLIQINTPGFTGDFSMLLSNNANTGGTCFGDSGGPNFLGSGKTETNIVAGVTSFGMNSNCAGTGGVFRMDRQDVLDFVGPFLTSKK